MLKFNVSSRESTDTSLFTSSVSISMPSSDYFHNFKGRISWVTNLKDKNKLGDEFKG